MSTIRGAAPQVPFVSNIADNMHCYSASLAMIVGYFDPTVEPTVELGNQISNKTAGKAAWPIAAPLWLKRHGYLVDVTFDFDYPALADRGMDYIRERYGEDVASWQQEHSDALSSTPIPEFLDEISFRQRVPQLADLEAALRQGKLAAITVNSLRLEGNDGYIGHSVVVLEMTDSHVTLHNPGLPPVPNQQVPLEDFLAAWGYPTDDARYLMAVGKPA